MSAAGREFVAPRELGTVESAARGELPFGFGRQILAGPVRVSLGVRVGDVHNGVVVEPLIELPGP